jgi:hypothetical protein
MDALGMGDWPLFLLHAAHGEIGNLDQCLATYRLHERGTWTGQSVLRKHQACLHAVRVMRANFPSEYRKAFARSQSTHEAVIIQHLAEIGVFGQARHALSRLLRTDPSLDREVRRLLRWYFMKASKQENPFSIERYQWMNLAYLADPAGFDLLSLPRGLLRRVYYRLRRMLALGDSR